jgi:hypothetical protein
MPPFFPEHGVLAACAGSTRIRAATSKMERKLFMGDPCLQMVADNGVASQASSAIHAKTHAF